MARHLNTGWRILKSLALKLWLFFRRLTASKRPLPDFLIVGAQKSGTTSLARWLDQHPAIECALGKEVHFFDGGKDGGPDNWSKGDDWYRSHFPLRQSGLGKLAFEATPMYLFHPLAATRIRDTLPNTKIIMILRNPSERAISHYLHSVSRGHEDLPLGDALDAEERRLDDALANADFESTQMRRFSYKARGHYADQVRRYFDQFPREDVLVLLSDDLFENPASTVDSVCRFVGADPGQFRPDLAPQNVSVGDSKVPAELRLSLDAYFAEPNAELARLLDRPLPW